MYHVRSRFRSHTVGKNAWHQVDVEWDHRGTLMLALPPDRIEILQGAL
jgi:hypothetical protein